MREIDFSQEYTDIVEREETIFVNSLLQWEQRAEDGAVQCKCHMCQREAIRARNAVTDELVRQTFIPDEDEEEQIIYQLQEGNSVFKP